MEQKNYKRKDRSVSPEAAQKISNSLKTYNVAHPRGTAASGSAWARAIQQGVKDYWSKVPPKKDSGQDGTKIEDIML